MSQVENLITQHLDIWTQATEAKSTAGRGTRGKINLLGIQKLRELILEMAVRGLLVPQDPNDEPASELLKKIAAEKAQLIKDGKIKKSKPLPEITDDEKPFELPKGWEWVRLGEVGNVFNGNSINERIKKEKYTNVEGLPFIATKDVGYGFEPLNYDNGVKIPVGEPKFVVAHSGAVLICAEGGSAGKKCGITDQDICFGNKLFVNEPFASIDPKFILAIYLSPSFYEKFSEVMTGIIGGISRSNFINLPLQLPPLDEQTRIVAKVDELMALCDALETQTLDSIATHQKLVETLLGNLVNPDNSADSHQAWLLIEQHFDVLFTTEHSIDTLKQTILQLAVMGKLVPQDPNDEPASELLKKIAAEKAQLIKDGKIKKSKPLPPITDNEKPFDLPKGWEWCRVIDLAVVGTGATPSRAEARYYNPPEFNWVTSGETSSEFVFETSEMISKKAIKETNVSIYPVGTLIMAMYGQGKTRGQITELKIPAGTNQACAAIQLITKDDSHRAYIKNYFKKSYEEIREAAAGGAQPNLNVGKVSANIIALPPKEEQTRIVAKVNQLMTLCDQLKSKLQIAQTTQAHLAQTITQEALA